MNMLVHPDFLLLFLCCKVFYKKNDLYLIFLEEETQTKLRKYTNIKTYRD